MAFWGLCVISYSELLLTKPKARSGQSYPICTHDSLSHEHGLLPVKNVTGDERAHAQNKSFILDVLNNEFDRALKFSPAKRGYTHILRMNQLIAVFFLCNIKLKATC